MTVSERIVAIASRLFVLKGIRGITMDDIATESGVSKRTIYELFRDKDHLLTEAIKYFHDHIKIEKDKVIISQQNTIEKVLTIVKFSMKTIKEINPLYFSDLKRYHYTVWEESLYLNSDSIVDQTVGILNGGIEEGAFREEIDVLIVAKLVHEQLRIMTDEAIFPSELFSTSRVFENIMINFLRGISTKKGLTLIDDAVI